MEVIPESLQYLQLGLGGEGVECPQGRSTQGGGGGE